jgi:subtilisin family serine protease
MTGKQDAKFRVSVFCESDDERERVTRLLKSVDPDHTYPYQGVVDGWMIAEKMPDLTRGAVTVVRLGTPSEGGGFGGGGGSGGGSARPEPRSRSPFEDLSRSAPDMAAASDRYEVRLKEAIRPDWREDLVANGEIRAQHQPNLFEMVLTPDAVRRVRQFPYVAAVMQRGLGTTVTPELFDAMRVGEAHLEVRSRALPTGAGAHEPALDVPTPPAPQLTFEAVTYTPAGRRVVQNAILAAGGAELVGEAATVIRFRGALDRALLNRLTEMSEVKSVSTYTPPTMLADRVREIIGIDKVNSGPTLERWTGSGEIVGILDSGVDSTHPDLADRVQATLAIEGASATDRTGHGTHIAGIIAGSGLASGAKIRGVAPGARLVVVGITNDAGTPQLEKFVDLGSLAALATENGAKILNLSWGMAVGGSYDHGSASVDRFVHEHPDVLMVVAAGNAGAEDALGDLRFNTVGAPATAKNVLTVGASATDRSEDVFQGRQRSIKQTWAEARPSRFQTPKAIATLAAGDPDAAAAISSRGPTDFDSVKPDVLAPGTFILSTRAVAVPDSNYELPCDQYPGARYAYLTGSSMAAPAIAAAAAVVRQYLRVDRKTANPSAALLKAILIASTKRLPSTTPSKSEPEIGYPDFGQGYGRVDLSSILPHAAAPIGRKLLFVDVGNASPGALESRAPIGAASKAMCTYLVQVPNGVAEPLRIVLTWTDVPGNSVQNNLQLEVRGPDRSYVGNADHRYRKDPAFDDTNQEGIVFDKRNIVELVYIEHPTPGDYRLRVIAQNTAYPPQGYALCVCGVVATEKLQPASA